MQLSSLKGISENKRHIMPQQNTNSSSMLGKFFETVFMFAFKMFLWATWAVLRATELIAGGIATWIKNNLNK